MKLEEMKEKSREMLAAFIDMIGLDGEYYSKLNNTPIAYGRIPLGKYYGIKSAELDNFLEKRHWDENLTAKIRERGLILINSEFRDIEPDTDTYCTIIHEMIHANRDLLIQDVQISGRNENAYLYNAQTNNFEQTRSNNKEDIEQNELFRDASQEILKGRIDNSQDTIAKHKDKTDEEIDNLNFADGKIDEKMMKQGNIDEALVEIMACLASELYSAKQRGKDIDIYSAIERLPIAYEKSENYEEIKAVCDIILRHQDFELFYWMIDPIEYSYGDIHYDFFAEYTKGDKDLLGSLYDYDEDLELDEDEKINDDDER